MFKLAKPLIFILMFCLVLGGCAVGPDFHSPDAPNTNAYIKTPLPAKTVSTKISGGNSQILIEGKDLLNEWWLLFHSPALNELVRRGLEKSPTVKAAQAALQEAKENLQVQIGSTLLPSVNGVGGAERERISGSSFGGLGILSTPFNLYNTSVQVSYTLDIFGGARREVEAFAALVDYQQFVLEATYLTLTANIVTAAISDASLRSQIVSTQQIIQMEEKQVHILRQQLDLGGITRSDLLAQEALLAQTKVLLPALEKLLAQNRDALAALVGSLPSEAELPSFDLEKLVLPAELPLSVPSELVRHRPDIRAAEALLHQASAQIGVATANLFPQLSVSGNYGNTSNQLRNLWTGNSTVWNIGAQVAQPIFHGGALLAARRSAIAGYEQALSNYQETVLLGFQNVADALYAVEYDAQILNSQVDAEEAARATLEIIREQYALGAANYLLLLIADRQYQQARITRIKAQSLRYADTAALFQALGGGWWNRSTERPLINKELTK